MAVGVSALGVAACVAVSSNVHSNFPISVQTYGSELLFAMNVITSNMYPGKSSVKAAIYGFGRIGRNVLSCWHG